MAAISWEERARNKRSRILSEVPEDFIHPELSFSETDTSSVMAIPDGLLDASELQITFLDAPGIVSSIQEGTYTAEKVLRAFTHRAVIAHQLLHCCLDFMYPEALAAARQLDEEFARTGVLKGPLHGVPVSVKDQCRIAGTETTCGFIANLGTYNEEDCLLVSILKEAGAVVFCKTSLSVGCMWGETVNNIIGRTSNPHNRSFSSGGSSGGEGALIAFRGSPLGVGSDLGGSIRSPSAYNGIWGLKPSSGRIPYYQVLNSMEGQETISSVVGPMASSLESLRIFTQAVLSARPWEVDPKCIPLPWRPQEYEGVRGRPLRLGFLHWDGVILPQPPVRRALCELEGRAREAGHEVVQIPFASWGSYKEALSLASRVYSSDASGDVERTIRLSGEPPLEVLGATDEAPLTLLESWSLAMETMNYQADVLRLWKQTGSLMASGEPIDAIVSPVNPSVCPKHGDYGQVRYLTYTGVVNVLDFSACTIPVTSVDDGVDLADVGPQKDGAGADIPAPTCELDEKIRGRYDPQKYKGMPVTLQIIGRRLEEEKVLAVADILDSLRV